MRQEVKPAKPVIQARSSLCCCDFFFFFFHDRFMSVSTAQPAPCAHIYTKRKHQRLALITRQKINTSPQMVSFTQSFLCICTTV